MQLQTLLIAVLGSPMVPVHADPDFVVGGSDYTKIYSIYSCMLLLYPSLASTYIHDHAGNLHLNLQVCRWEGWQPLGQCGEHVGNMSEGRYRHTVVSVGNAALFVAGGYVRGNPAGEEDYVKSLSVELVLL